MDELTRLALAAAEGDRIALHGLVRATQVDVWRFCAHLGDRSMADDLTQETYVRALRALPSFRGDAGARTWLLAIARRTVADSIRSSRRRRRLGAAAPRPRSQSGPDEGVALRAAVDDLGADRRAAFVLTQLLGLSYAEAAGVCGVAVGTIRSRVARARADLVVALQEPAASG
ncbi:MAG TPA: sigma-70 family RNA polymerase sigma factor [Acidimicrobiales bacterium]|nr:sigma-70 family RNA polymerase sigma factor [Acidimicrobiales bacterium]